MAHEIPYKIYLSEKEIPTTWYNVKAHMKTQHPPFLNPATGKPCTKADLQPVFCDECIDQELNETDERIEIPEGIRDFYRMFRPSPLVRAYYLEKLLDTPAEIYYKFEGNNTSGSHKLNSAAARMACALSGAGRIPSHLANMTAASNTLLCSTETARMYPS